MFARGVKLLLTSGAVIGTVSCAAPLAFANELKESPSSLLINQSSSPVKWDRNWDFMDPSSYVKPNSTDEEKEAKKSKATRHIYLIRHGQYDQEHDEDEKRILTAIGRDQAAATGARLAELAEPYSHCVISTMTRANETGEIILKHLPADIKIDKTDMLREGAPIRPEPKSKNWKPEAWFFQDGSRIEAAFRKYMHRSHYSQETDSHEVIVCHSNVIRYIVCRALQNAPEGWLRMSLANGSITHIVIRPNGNVSLRGLGEKGHLPPNLVTYN